MPYIQNRLQIKIYFAILTAVALAAAVCFLFFPKKLPLILQIPAENSYVKILFAGDMMFDRTIRQAAKANGNDFIFEKISPLLAQEDLAVANLEGPLTDNPSVSVGAAESDPKYITFTFDPSLAGTLYKQNIRLVDLGNNHALNFKQAGLESTEKYLSASQVNFFGGNNRSIIKEIGGLKIAFVSYNKYADSKADEIEQNLTLAKTKQVRQYADIVVVYCHWGKEFSTQPIDPQRNLAHELIDAGSDLIIGSHPHVIETTEIYNGKKIYYSLGNFIFDQRFNQGVQNGLGVEVKINKKTKQMEFADKYFHLEANGQTVEKTSEK